MAGLNSYAPPPRWTLRQTAGQFRAIAWLRWRMVVNGFRRKGGTGELVARLFVYPIFAAMALVPTLGAGVVAWYFAANEHLEHIDWLLWIAFALGQALSINLARPGTTFDPNELIRFPVRLRRFVLIRLFFGTLSPANVVVSLISIAVAIGVILAQPRLWLYTLLALTVFAFTNILFTRMVFAWVDRWLSTRRAREIFTLFVFAGSIAIQWANVTFNPAYNHTSRALSHHRFVAVVHFFERIHPFLTVLPPELTTYALIAAHHHHGVLFLMCLAGTAAFAAVFLAVFTIRMRTEYRGESLSDVANAVSSPADSSTAGALDPELFAFPGEDHMSSRTRAVWAILRKELLYVRRNTGLFYSLVVPVLMVFLFATRIALRTSNLWILPGAIAYSLLSVVPLSYNVFGLESTGIQFYFLAPIRLRDVFLAKNVLNFLLASVEILAITALISYLRGRQPFEIVLLCLLWGAATLLIGMTVGNMRSVSAPTRIEFSRAAAKQASPVNAFLSMGILLLSALLGWSILVLSAILHVTWILIPAFVTLLLAAIVTYITGLRRIERYALDRRESLYGVLAKY